MCRKVALEMGEPYASGLELISFHTVSKGVYGECGLRGGYFECLNIHPDTVAGALACECCACVPSSMFVLQASELEGLCFAAQGV